MSTTPRIGLLHTGTFTALRTLEDPALQPYRIEGIYLPDADPAGVKSLDVVIVGDRLHAGVRSRFEPAIREALQDPGKIVVVLGENSVQDWLPGIGYSFRAAVNWCGRCWPRCSSGW